MTYSLKQLLLVTAAIAITIWFLRSAYLGFTQVETAENMTAVGWLPDDATDVSYFRSYMNTAYEFAIDERGFRDWSRWDVAEIDEPVGITRYSYFARPLPDLGPNPTSNEIADYEQTKAERSVTISDGLYYGYLQDNGGGVWVGYDRSRGRAYFQSAPR